MNHSIKTLNVRNYVFALCSSGRNVSPVVLPIRSATTVTEKSHAAAVIELWLNIANGLEKRTLLAVRRNSFLHANICGCYYSRADLGAATVGTTAGRWHRQNCAVRFARVRSADDGWWRTMMRRVRLATGNWPTVERRVPPVKVNGIDGGGGGGRHFSLRVLPPPGLTAVMVRRKKRTKTKIRPMPTHTQRVVRGRCKARALPGYR